MDMDRMPVLIGVSEVTEKVDDPERGSSPMALMLEAVRAAADSARLDPARLRDLDAIAVVKSMREFTRNSPEALAAELGADRAQRWITPLGGNMPQYLVNRFAEEISLGLHRFVLFAGTEAMATGRKLVKAGKKPDWSTPSTSDPDYLVTDRPLWTEHEKAHGFFQARHVYPLFENALRGHYGRGIDEHQLELGRLFSRFSEVAAANTKAWYPIARSPEEIAFESPQNRIVGWPYTKYMNAMNQVNQSAAIIMCSAGFARELGVPEDRWVYLTGCADANELWDVTDRQNYFSSPAIRTMGREAFRMAGRDVSEVDYIDIYACFPVAVQIARDELGIAKDDPRPLTVTGGLPYYGGAGSYVLNAIAAVVDKVRENPGSLGMATANGGYLTEHALGLYSTEPPPPPADGDAPWRRVDPAVYQAEIDALSRPPLVETANGDAVIETYSVGFDRNGEPDLGLVVGRLGEASDPMAPRFIAQTPLDAELLRTMTSQDCLGAPGRVANDGRLNVFRPS